MASIHLVKAFSMCSSPRLDIRFSVSPIALAFDFQPFYLREAFPAMEFFHEVPFTTGGGIAIVVSMNFPSFFPYMVFPQNRFQIEDEQNAAGRY